MSYQLIDGERVVFEVSQAIRDANGDVLYDFTVGIGGCDPSCESAYCSLNASSFGRVPKDWLDWIVARVQRRYPQAAAVGTLPEPPA